MTRSIPHLPPRLALALAIALASGLAFLAALSLAASASAATSGERSHAARKKSCEKAPRSAHRSKAGCASISAKHSKSQPSGKGSSSPVPPPAPAASEPPAATEMPSVSPQVIVAPEIPKPTSICDTLAAIAAEGFAPSCWRPYSPSSPWNREVPANPAVDPSSSLVVQRLASWGAPQNLLAGDAETSADYYHPIYFSQSTDPIYTLETTKPWGNSGIDGDQIHIPARAKPAGGGDAHLSVIGPEGWEYDLWAVESKPANGGTLRFAWGGKTRVDGDGLGSNATAAHFGLAAGVIRAQELKAGKVEHALFMGVKCTEARAKAVYPAAANTGEPCSERGSSNTNAPAMGSRFVLKMSDSEIAALSAPRWKKTILTAMAHYGMYVGDAIGSGSWGLQLESGSTYTSLGEEDQVAAFAKSEGLPEWNGMYVFDVGSGVNWQSRLQLLSPCVSEGTC